MLYVLYKRQSKESPEKRFAYQGNVPKNHRQLEVEKSHNISMAQLQRQTTPTLLGHTFRARATRAEEVLLPPPCRSIDVEELLRQPSNPDFSI